jgi:hypothetical protein
MDQTIRNQEKRNFEIIGKDGWLEYLDGTQEFNKRRTKNFRLTKSV